MKKINEILSLNLAEDIKNVIDLEDRSENEIQLEIESYIVTDGIGEHLYNFTNQFTSNIRETGVWLSGFYGSGKSYFGKMIGYIIDNKTINGTPARERFIPRLKGVTNESLIENSIRKLESINSRVIFLDVAKQNTDKGLAFTLFSNLLKHLGFRDDIYGYMEFDLFIEGKLNEFKNIVKELEDQEWNILKKSNRLVAKIMRSVYLKMSYTEIDYQETLNVYKSSIADFSATKFKELLEKYLNFKKDETLVFIFDETSEAISQNKFTLLDLEGVSEALSSIKQVWSIAIAQEKLDNIILNSNINRNQLTKVTDRFKTKIHLESSDVGVIIKSRLLQKTETGNQELLDYYKSHEGHISNATNLKSTIDTKTQDANIFATYYPFHQYQFELLQKFLFTSNALSATQIAARGMIITTFDVLRRQMSNKDLYSFTTGYDLCSQAQTAPPFELTNKYDTAIQILEKNNSKINGGNLLKTIHIHSDSVIIPPTLENITKSYITNIETYYDNKALIEKALNLLVESKILLFSNNNYKITSDLEGKLLEEMNDINIEYFTKKATLITYIKDYKLFASVSSFNESNDNFKFSIHSEQEDLLSGVANKPLKINVHSLFNITEERENLIETIRVETQYAKDLISIIPNNNEFNLIDKLLTDIKRYSYMEEKYCNESDVNKRQIIRDFTIMKEEKEKELRIKIENAYYNSSLIYMYDEDLLNKDTFKTTISETQRKLIKNIYTKRLPTGLSESLVPKIFSSPKEKLYSLFQSEDFKFFDKLGNFTGKNLKITEEIIYKIKGIFVDGATLESSLSGAPWAYSFGTIVASLAAIFRANSLSVKYNGETYFYQDKSPIQDVFTNATKFKSASFKSINSTLPTIEKQEAIQILMNLDIESHINTPITYNTTDFNLADSIQAIAECFLSILTTLKNTHKNFESMFPTVADQKSVLTSFTGKTNESNYIEKVQNLLRNKDGFSSAILTIINAEKFIKKKFTKVQIWNEFINGVKNELVKSNQTNNTFDTAKEEFLKLYALDMVKNYNTLLEQVQIVKDTYFNLIKNAASGMSYKYQELNGKIDVVLKELDEYPANLNIANKLKLHDLKSYSTNKIIKEPELDFSISCKKYNFSLSEILNYTELAPSKENDLLICKSNFIKNAPIINESKDTNTINLPRKVKLKTPSKDITAGEYRKILSAQIQSLAGLNDADVIDLEIS